MNLKEAEAVLESNPLKQTGNYLKDITAILKEANDEADRKAAERAIQRAKEDVEWNRKLAERDLSLKLLQIIDESNAEYEYNKAKGFSNE